MATKRDDRWKWNRYRDGYFIPQRKRIYLYWFKFLQEAERSPEFKVNWNKYRGWGGSIDLWCGRGHLDVYEHSLELMYGVIRHKEKWWRCAESNRGPSDCEPDALPTELHPHLVRKGCHCLINSPSTHINHFALLRFTYYSRTDS